MQTSLSVTEMVRGFSDYINRVVYRRESFVLLKGRKPVAEIRPIPAGVRLSELETVLKSLPALTPEEVKAFGEDIDEARRARAMPTGGTVGSPDAGTLIWIG